MRVEDHTSADFWVRSFEPLLKKLFKKHGQVLCLEYEDFKHDAWVHMYELIQSGKLEGKPAVGYIARALHNYFISKVRHRLTERSFYTEMSAVASQQERYDASNFDDLVLVVRTELTDQEINVLENLIVHKKSIKDFVSKTPGLTRRQYDTINDKIRSKVAEYVKR